MGRSSGVAAWGLGLRTFFGKSVLEKTLLGDIFAQLGGLDEVFLPGKLNSWVSFSTKKRGATDGAFHDRQWNQGVAGVKGDVKSSGACDVIDQNLLIGHTRVLCY